MLYRRMLISIVHLPGTRVHNLASFIVMMLRQQCKRAQTKTVKVRKCLTYGHSHAKAYAQHDAAVATLADTFRALLYIDAALRLDANTSRKHLTMTPNPGFCEMQPIPTPQPRVSWYLNTSPRKQTFALRVSFVCLETVFAIS